MKKNTLVYIGLFLVLGGIAAYFLMNRSNTTLDVDAQDFAVEDTSEIYKIKLSDKNASTVTLTRDGNKWLLNDKYKAQKSQVKTLLETIKMVKVKSPVPLNARNNVIKIMSTSAVKTEIYNKNNKLIKSYYVGGTTPDELGTFMLLENAEEPFITHIPGFFGYLSSRYIANEKDWRSSEIYALNPSEIKEITVRYHSIPDASFKLRTQGDNFFIVPFQGSAEQKLKEQTAKRLLSGYRNINYEQFAEITKEKRDSILSSKPFVTINVYTQGNPPPPLILYNKMADSRTKGVGPNNEDLDKFYGVIGEGNREIVLVQRAMVAKILPGFQDLIK